MKVENMVSKPLHYTSGKFEDIEVIEHIASKYADPVQATRIAHVARYITRAPQKNGEEDLKKALNYMHRAVTGEWFYD